MGQDKELQIDTPERDSLPDNEVLDDSLDDQPDGDRQLVTDSDMIDGGTNDSDLGAAASGPILQNGTPTLDKPGLDDVAVGTTPGDHTSDRATGITALPD